jgi:hypothetical protein
MDERFSMSHRRSAVSALGQPLFATLIATCVACSSGEADDALKGLGSHTTGGTGGSSAAGGSGSSATSGGSATGGTTVGGIIVDPGSGGASAGSGSAGTSGTMGNGMPETCDGIDNDANGIIDDVDAGGDGVCDCLSIGTIGQIGPWSDGGDIFASWLDARTPQGAVRLDDAELTAANLGPLQVIVVLHVDTTSVENNGVTANAHHAFSDAEAAAFGAWIQSGGGVMTTIGYTNDEANEVTNVNRLLGTVGMGYSGTNLSLSGYVKNWTAHALTTGISNIFTDNGVEPTVTSGTTLAQDDSGRIALQVTEAGSGRVVVWGDEWMTYDSEWADVQDQQVELFWLNILKWLSPPKTCQVPIPPGLVK